MLAHRIETTVQEDGTLTLEDLPFHSGASVEGIILLQPQPTQKQYSLRGNPVHYIDPLDLVAQDDWEAIA